MMHKLWFLIFPFKSTFYRYIGLAFVYESVQVAMSYRIPLIVRLFEAKTELAVWAVLLLGILIADELFMRLDNAFDYQIIARQSYPIYEHLKLGALKQFLALGLPWHRTHHSGALVGKVSNGVWKVIEIIDSLSWEFIPTMMQAVVSFVPLAILSPWVAMLSAGAFSLFLWLQLDRAR